MLGSFCKLHEQLGQLFYIVEQLSQLLFSFQGSALERTAFEAPPRVGHAFATQEAGASGALRHQAEPGDECQTKQVGSSQLAVGRKNKLAVVSWQLAERTSWQ